jgi:hypothetical protein
MQCGSAAVTLLPLCSTHLQRGQAAARVHDVAEAAGEGRGQKQGGLVQVSSPASCGCYCTCRAMQIASNSCCQKWLCTPQPLPDGQEEVGVNAGAAAHLAGLQGRGCRVLRSRDLPVWHPLPGQASKQCAARSRTCTLPLLPVVVQAQPPVSWEARSAPASRPVVPEQQQKRAAPR